ncbi:hypothetical protein PED39_02115 [Methanomassiliicoccales archaeon LGM-RCC1]|nr:hypothetical protein PED39_02115 [Methanomassiliicoccales archaeon LGM-RCC1]
MREELLKGLTEEQKEMIKDCRSMEELLSIAKREGVELSEEQLGAVTGGCGTEVNPVCPNCGCTEFTETMSGGVGYYECQGCGTKYNGMLQYK